MQTGVGGETVAGLAGGRDAERVIQPLDAAARALLLVSRLQRIRQVQQRLQAARAAHQQIAQMRTDRGHEMRRIETLRQDLVQQQQRRRIVPGKGRVHQAETVIIIQHAQIADHVRAMDILAAESDRLVEKREGITHGAVGLVRDHVQRLVVDRNPLLAGDIPQVADDVRHADAVEIVGLAAAQDGRENLVLLRGREDENRVCRRLLKGLEESIERRRGEHVHLIDDIDRIASHLGWDLHLVHQVLDVIHTVVGRRIQFVDAVRPALRERTAGIALATGLEIGPGVGAVDGLGEDTRGARLADAPRAAEQISVRELPALDRILEGPRDIVLSDQRLERVGTVLAS